MLLEEKLKTLSTGKTYPFHMPGHKRVAFSDFPNPYAIDITEIEGFDDLHHARGLLAGEQARAAALYDSKRCYYLVNGSTCGILAAISAVVKPGDKVLVARNCHQSVYNALYLRRLVPVYVYPKDTRHGIQGQVAAADIVQKLAEHADIRAVVITSPTYDGVVSDVAAIAQAVHEKGLPLIVDEAHGAHFGFHEAFPENATRLGADVVVMSVHKTLPSFTQTALLHLCSDRVDGELLERFLRIYESSSPSYVLMAGISRCVDFLMEPETEGRFAWYAKMLAEFREQMRSLKCLRVLGAEDFDGTEAFSFDAGKIVICVPPGVSGAWLKEYFLQHFGLCMEMAGPGHVLAMTSLMDSREGFARLASVLEVLDKSFSGSSDDWRGTKGSVSEALTLTGLYREQEKCQELWEALEREHETVALGGAIGRISADYVCMYPPGTPILAPGERIDADTAEHIAMCTAAGLAVEGIVDSTIRVVKS